MPKVILQNINHPGSQRWVDRERYEAMRKAYPGILPDNTPGLTVEEIDLRIAPLLPESLFPGGAAAGWWAKCVQLDPEAKDLVRRAKGSPIRLRRAAAAPASA